MTMDIGAFTPAALRLRCCASDAGTLPAQVVYLCCDGFRQALQCLTRPRRWATAVAIAVFVGFVLMVMLGGLLRQRVIAFDAFADMIVWLVIFYGYCAQMHGERIRVAELHRAGRMNAWASMLSRFILSARRLLERLVWILLGLVPLIHARVRARLRLRLGLVDPNLVARCLLPPQFGHA
ncbi:hypothetical protein [Paraburkholderia sp. Ac-20347]|uniref:hypothetical protein n=1 Tax=Paraburkholderia sp. Ac-20347 TaxID=2703892 RepID=UPI001980A809|nr:hypothetical protein [Paraburkholderia sp. Ac-20347]MBN3808149.1 hypothetical protein [Paraburkholderia sp. Ac-20347]